MPETPSPPPERTPGPGARPAAKSPVPGGYSQLFNRALLGGYVAEAGSAGRQIYYACVFLADHTHAFRFRASVRAIAKLSGVNVQTARAGLKRLAEVGLLRVVQTGYQTASGRDPAGNVPALYQLLVPEARDFFDDLPRLRGWDLHPEAGEILTPSPADASPPAGREPRTLKQPPGTRTKPNNTNKAATDPAEAADVVVLLKGHGVDDLAAMKAVSLDPDYVRAVVASVLDKPEVENVGGYIARWLQQKWPVSPKVTARLEREATAERRRAEREAQAQQLAAAKQAEESALLDERSRIDRVLSAVSRDELELLFASELDRLGDVGGVYRRAGLDHPGTRAMLARVLER